MKTGTHTQVPVTIKAPFSTKKLLSLDSKIGGTFITMPVKGVGDAFHECYKGLVTE